ncbi:unnamed protein product [Nyctereutes procyonoides]|uniref:(raccoon dog) hypothetical protein n=1 Tax=Nyctereutes procyonoides TaxID=34880 RepID=A0A811YSB7_NYCPR|nr:unnamed protein product [Nyctereutes procyonoides]
MRPLFSFCPRAPPSPAPPRPAVVAGARGARAGVGGGADSGPTPPSRLLASRRWRDRGPLTRRTLSPAFPEGLGPWRAALPRPRGEGRPDAALLTARPGCLRPSGGVVSFPGDSPRAAVAVGGVVRGAGGGSRQGRRTRAPGGGAGASSAPAPRALSVPERRLMGPVWGDERVGGDAPSRRRSLPTAACASPLRDRGGSRRAGPASGVGCVARVRVRVCARPGGVLGRDGPPRPPTPTVCVARERLAWLAVWAPARSRAEFAAGGGGAAGAHGSGQLLPGGASPGRDSGLDRTDGQTERRMGGRRFGRPPRGRGSRVPGPRRSEAGRRPGRRGTALVLVAVGSRARLTGALLAPPLARPSRDRAFPTRSRPSPAARLLPVAADPPRLPASPDRTVAGAPRVPPLTPPSGDRKRDRSCWVSCPPGRHGSGGGVPGRSALGPPRKGRREARGGCWGGASLRVCERAFSGEPPREVACGPPWGPGRRPRVLGDRPCAGGLGRWDPACAPGRPTLGSSEAPSEGSRSPLAVARGPPLHRSRLPFSGAWPLAAGGVCRPRPFPSAPSLVRRPSCRPGAALPGALALPGPAAAFPPASAARPHPGRWRCVVTRGRRRLPPPPTPAGRVPALARACPGRGSGPRRPLAEAVRGRARVSPVAGRGSGSGPAPRLRPA